MYMIVLHMSYIRRILSQVWTAYCYYLSLLKATYTFAVVSNSNKVNGHLTMQSVLIGVFRPHDVLRLDVSGQRMFTELIF